MNFENIICSSSTLVGKAHYSPYRHQILHITRWNLKVITEYHATLSISANTIPLSDLRYQTPALEYHQYALSYLRELLSHNTWEEKELDEILEFVLMLRQYDAIFLCLLSC